MIAPSVPQNQTTASMPKPDQAWTGIPFASRNSFTRAMRASNHDRADASGAL